MKQKVDVVGFEPTKVKPLDLKSSAVDRFATRLYWVVYPHTMFSSQSQEDTV